MTAALLMPKATAVWLVENTALSFDQVADFCVLHPLEVKAIADGDAAQGIKGLDPILTNQLTREQIDAAEADPEFELKLSDPKVRLPQPKNKKGPRYTPVSRRQGEADRHRRRGPDALARIRDHFPAARARAGREEAERRTQRRRGVCQT